MDSNQPAQPAAPHHSSSESASSGGSCDISKPLAGVVLESGLMRGTSQVEHADRTTPAATATTLTIGDTGVPSSAAESVAAGAAALASTAAAFVTSVASAAADAVSAGGAYIMPRSAPVPTTGVDYDSLRSCLLEAERALTRQAEAIAELRRKLPLRPCPNWVFWEGARKVVLTELFAEPTKDLVIVHHSNDMCSMWEDGYNGVLSVLEQACNFIVASTLPREEMEKLVAERGWRFRFVTMSDQTMNECYGVAAIPGPAISVFKLQDGLPHHFYSTIIAHGLPMDPKGRGMDVHCPVFAILDLLPSGRAAWPAYKPNT